MSRFPFCSALVLRSRPAAPGSSRGTTGTGCRSGTPPALRRRRAPPPTPRDTAASRCWACTCAAPPRRRAPERLRPSIAVRSSRRARASNRLRPPRRARPDRAHDRRVDRREAERRLRRRLVDARAPGLRDPRLLPRARRALPQLRARPHRRSRRRALAAARRQQLHRARARALRTWPRSAGRFAHARPATDKTQAGANMRFRLNPELHISDNLRVMSQIDMLDNLVLGSTPEGYANQPASSRRLQSARRRARTRRSARSRPRSGRPTPGINSFPNTITVKRAWGEYMTPVGQLRFGRMPSHWGLGMLANSGDGYDSDWQSTVDRIMFMTGIKKLDLYFAGTWDFANEGATSATFESQHRRPAVRSGAARRREPVRLVVVRRRNPELPELELAQGRRGRQRRRVLHLPQPDPRQRRDRRHRERRLGADRTDVRAAGYVRRGAKAYIPDLWLQFLYKKFRFEAEGVMVAGSIDSAESTRLRQALGDDNNSAVRPRDADRVQRHRGRPPPPVRLRLGSATRARSRRLGTQRARSRRAARRTGATPCRSASPDRHRSREFRFHPDYRVDLILFRNILSRVQGAYYFRPSVEYDFTRRPNGQRSAAARRSSGAARASSSRRRATSAISASSSTSSSTTSRRTARSTTTPTRWAASSPCSSTACSSRWAASATCRARTVPDTSTAQTLRWYIGVLY